MLPCPIPGCLVTGSICIFKNNHKLIKFTQVTENMKIVFSTNTKQQKV